MIVACRRRSPLNKKVKIPLITLSMKSVLLLTAAVVIACPVQGALIASWSQDEPSGDLIDGSGAHPPGVLVTGGSVNYSQPGVPAGNYGSIIVSTAAGTS